MPTTSPPAPERTVRRLLLVTSRPGGDEPELDAMLRRAVESGWAIDVTPPTGECIARSPFADQLLRVPWAGAGRSWGRFSAARRRLQEIVAASRYDAVLAGDPLAALVLRTLPRKTTRESCLVFAPPSLRFLDTGSAFRRRLLRFGFRRLLGGLDVVLTSGNADAEAAAGVSGGTGCAHIDVPGLRIDLDRLARPVAQERIAELRRLFGIEAGQVLVAVPFAFTERSRCDLLLGLAEELGGTNVRLVVLGTGPLEVVVRQTARERALLHIVRFAGARRSGAEFAAASDVGLLVSPRHGADVHARELMALGKPCVAPAYPDLTTVVTEPAALAEAGDLSGLASLLGTMADDAALRRMVGEAQRERVLGTLHTNRDGMDLDAVCALRRGRR